jgi:hypothetical protein
MRMEKVKENYQRAAKEMVNHMNKNMGYMYVYRKRTK